MRRNNNDVSQPQQWCSVGPDRRDATTNQPEEATELPVEPSFNNRSNNIGLDANGRVEGDRWASTLTMRRDNNDVSQPQQWCSVGPNRRDATTNQPEEATELPVEPS
jgi:hypothetical protein